LGVVIRASRAPLKRANLRCWRHRLMDDRFKSRFDHTITATDDFERPAGEIHVTADRINCPRNEINAIVDRFNCPQSEIHPTHGWDSLSSRRD